MSFWQLSVPFINRHWLRFETVMPLWRAPGARPGRRRTGPRPTRVRLTLLSVPRREGWRVRREDDHAGTGHGARSVSGAGVAVELCWGEDSMSRCTPSGLAGSRSAAEPAAQALPPDASERRGDIGAAAAASGRPWLKTTALHARVSSDKQEKEQTIASQLETLQ